MSKQIRRLPKNYDGTQVTNKEVRSLLPSLLGQIGGAFKERGDLIIASWKDVIGPKLAEMTEATAFKEGILYVKVRNSTLYSLLSQHNKQQILTNLRKKFPTVEIKNIFFR